jgi:CRISPR-associated protein Csm5
VIRGEPRSDQEGAVIQEQFKDVYDQPYLPGSSLKGALRTALGWHVWKEKDLEPDVEKLMDPRKGQPYPGRFAATNYEHDVFGKEANKTKNDFLRALHVSDSKPLPPSCLLLLNVRVINPGTSTKPASDIPVELEAIRPDTTFETSLKLDLALFSQWAQRYGLHLSGREWLTDLPRIANTHARDQIVREAKWFRHLPGGNRVAEFYERLEQTPLDGQRFFLRLGWGTGWENKTFGSRLQADEDFMNYIVSYYRMKKGNGEMGDAFPASRRASVRVKGEAGEEIGAPLGWVLVEMQERV